MSNATQIIKNYQSIKQRYSGTDVSNLELRMDYYNNEAMEIKLVNLFYLKQLNSKFMQFLLWLGAYMTFYAIYHLTPLSVVRGLILIEIFFALWLLNIVVSTSNLVKKESLIYCAGFGVELETERFWPRRRSFFIMASNMYDLVLNEVIENLDIHYLLILRTQGRLFKDQPIKPIFNALNPTVDCLEAVYTHLKTIMVNDIRI